MSPVGHGDGEQRVQDEEHGGEGVGDDTHDEGDTHVGDEDRDGDDAHDGGDAHDGEDARGELAAAVVADVLEYFDERFDGDEATTTPVGAVAGHPGEAAIRSDFFDFSWLEDDQEVVEWRWVDEPYALVAVCYHPDDREYNYRVVEPTLDWFEEYVRSDLVRSLRSSLMYRDLAEDAEDADDVEAVFVSEARTLIAEEAATVAPVTRHKIKYYLLRDFLGYGPIDPIMRDPPVEDISCDGQDLPVFVYHREYRDLPTTVSFGAEDLDSYVFRLSQRAGKQLTVSNPLVDASLPDGSRVQLTLGGDVSTRGSNFTIRKFADVPLTPVDMIRSGTFSPEQLAYFWLVIENNRSLIFAGGTGSGKTSSLNAVSFFIPPNSKVVSIEDTREVDLPHRNWIQSVTRGAVEAGGRGEVSTYRLLQAALRQRPEYIIVGEIRTEERVALTFFQAMSTGHTAYTTVHADSPDAVLTRLHNQPLNVPTAMLEDLDVVSVQKQTVIGDDRVRRNDVVAEMVPRGNDDRLETVAIFERDPRTDSHDRVGDSRVLAEIAEEWGWDGDELAAQLEARERLLRYLHEEDITDYADVAAAIQLFHRKPDEVRERLDAGTLGRADLRAAADPDGPDAVDLDGLDPTDLDGLDPAEIDALDDAEIESELADALGARR